MADRPLADVFADLREALRPPACRALENLADALHRRPLRWPTGEATEEKAAPDA